MKVWVVVPVFNRPDLLDRCLTSIATQDDPDFAVVIADDASTDPEVWVTMQSWAPVIRDRGRRECLLLSTSVNQGSVRNLATAIGFIPDITDDDVVLIVDGDDRLSDPGSIQRIREMYEGTDVLVAYGSYAPDPDDLACHPATPIPAEVLEEGSIREFTATEGQWFNHPISFRYRAFTAIDESDFLLDDDWMRYAYDRIFMLPLIELAGTRVAFSPDVNYIYTSDRPDSVAVGHRDATNAENDHVTLAPRKYEPLP